MSWFEDVVRERGHGHGHKAGTGVSEGYHVSRELPLALVNRNDRQQTGAASNKLELDGTRLGRHCWPA